MKIFLSHQLENKLYKNYVAVTCDKWSGVPCQSINETNF